jgi:hypothetical protein
MWRGTLRIEDRTRSLTRSERRMESMSQARRRLVFSLSNGSAVHPCVVLSLDWMSLTLAPPDDGGTRAGEALSLRSHATLTSAINVVAASELRRMGLPPY